jgi:sigma54-dependent transcription regulator
VSGTIRSKALPDVAKVPNDWIQSGGSVFLVENNQLVIKSVEVLFSSRTESLIHGLDTDDLLLAEVLTTAFDGMAVEAKLEK